MDGSVPLNLKDRDERAGVENIAAVLDRKGYGAWSVEAGDSVYDAIGRMAEKQIGALIVFSEGSRLAGILTERDYSRKVILQGRSSRTTAVGEIMTPSPVTATLDQTVEDGLRTMAEHGVHHLPVMDGPVVVGIVSVGDFVKSILMMQAHTIDQLHHYISGKYPE